MSKLLTSSGRLQYLENFKLNIEVDEQIVEFAKYLVPKYIGLRKQKYKPHITVIRNEIISNLNKWGLYHDTIINFQYDNYIYNDDNYYWLRAFCPKLNEIRLELGLPISSQYSRAPDNFESFHITIGNTKR